MQIFASYLSSFFYCVIDFYLLHKLLKRRRGGMLTSLAATALLALFVCRLGLLPLFYGFSAIVAFLAILTYTAIFLWGSFLEKVLLCAICITLQGAVDMVTVNILRVLSDPGGINLTLQSVYVLLGSAISILLFMIAAFFLSKLHWHVGSLNKRVLGMLTTFPFACFLMIMLYKKYSAFVAVTSPFMLFAACSLFLIALFALIVFNRLSQYMNDTISTQQRLHAAQQRFALQKDMDSIYESMRKLRHDMNNHCISMTALLENKEYLELAQYLKQIASVVQPDIKHIDTGNTILDSILNTKIFTANAMDIDVTASVCLPLIGAIEDMDLCSLLGNIIDNAIEAVAKLPAGQRKINLRIKILKGYLSFFCSNPTNGDCIPDGSLFSSTKKSSIHGFGLKQAAFIAAKYQGDFFCEHVNNTFTVNVMLLICSNPGDYDSVMLLSQ